MTTTLEPPVRGTRVRDQLVRVAEAATTPCVPADFLDLFAPLRSGADLRGRIEEIHPETPDAATIVIRPGADWARPRARPVPPHRHRRRRRPPVARLLAHPRPARRRPHLDHRQGRARRPRQQPPRPRLRARHDGPPRAGGRRVRPAARGRQATSSSPPGPASRRSSACCATSSRAPTTACCSAERSAAHDIVVVHVAPSHPDSIFIRDLEALDAAGAIRLVARYDDEHGVLDVDRPRRPGRRPRRAPYARLRPRRPARRPGGAPRRGRDRAAPPSSSAPPASSPATAAPSPSPPAPRSSSTAPPRSSTLPRTPAC